MISRLGGLYISMRFKQANMVQIDMLYRKKTRVQIIMANSIRVPISPRKASIYKGLLGLGSNNMRAVYIHIRATDIVTKYTRVNKWKPIAGLCFRGKNIRYLVAFLVNNL